MNAYLHTREQNYPIEHVLVPVVSLPTLLQDEPVVDLVNFDCQVLNAPPVSLCTLKACILLQDRTCQNHLKGQGAAPAADRRVIFIFSLLTSAHSFGLLS